MQTTIERVKRHSPVFRTPPALVPSDKLVDGPIIGNGDVGVVLSGSPESLRFWISKCDFWKFKRMYPNGGPRPIGGVEIKISALQGASFQVRQCLYEAQLAGEFSAGGVRLNMKAFVPASANCLAIELQNDGADVHVDASLWVQTGDESTTERGHRDNIAYIVRAFEGDELLWSTKAAIALRSGDGLPQCFPMSSGQKVTLVAWVCTNFEHDDPLSFAFGQAGCTTQSKLDCLYQDHLNWWRAFWSKSSVEIPDALIEQYWYGSQYALACCSRNNGFPPGLFGNWITTDDPAWAGDYHLNYNHQAPWWGTYSSNHVELAEPYDTPILQYMEKAKENVRRFLGIQGVYYDVGIGPLGYNSSEFPDNRQFWGQKSNAAYAAVNMLMRYYHTHDLDYIRTVYPFLCEVALFWEEYLVRENGRFNIYRDAIHETDDSNTQTKNPILTLGLLKAFFQGMMDISGELGANGEAREKWMEILAGLAPYPTQQRNGKTVFRYTEEGLDWWGDNTLGIQHIWPCGTIGLESSQELLDLSKNTVEELARWDDYNGFPTFYTAAARVGYPPQIILEHMHDQCAAHGYSNLLIFYGGGGIECCSGVPSCINEMLLQSHEGVIRLFPTWPKNSDATFTTLRAVGAFLVSSSFCSGEVGTVRIQSEKGRPCRLQIPWMGRNTAVYEEVQGGARPVAYRMENDVLSFETEAWKTYRIEKMK